MAGGRHYKRQPKATEEEKAARLEALDSHNYRDVKQKRINMAFTPSNIQFMREVSENAHGKYQISQTKVVNGILELYRMEHDASVESNKRLLEYADQKYHYGAKPMGDRNHEGKAAEESSESSGDPDQSSGQ